MKKDISKKPEYGNWVSMRIILICLSYAFITSLIGFWFPWILLFSAIFLFWAIYFLLARWLFSDNGRGLQLKIQSLVTAQIKWNGQGKVLEIGCGNGPLAIEIAKKYPDSYVIGIDSWGKEWEYRLNTCKQNAKVEGVRYNTEFREASAEKLPFKNKEFDLVVSNLVFHEVHSAKDKRLLIVEALRVLKTGGVFVFQDLFLWKVVFGDPHQLVVFIKESGVSEAQLIETNQSDFIPWILKLPFMLGTLGLIYGKK